MAALLPSLCIFALAGGCAWSFLAARLFSHHSCQPFWGASETVVWRVTAPVPRFCQMNSKIWLFHKGRAGVWSPPGCRVGGMCNWLRGLELPAPESLPRVRGSGCAEAGGALGG